jgi:4-amino-4-deoxy-L-arabinose transferase-like glycosyltransferase
LAGVFLLSTLTAWLIVYLRIPLELHQAEDYLELAKTQCSTGVFNSTLRPPGYVGFLALIANLDPAWLRGNLLAVFLIQGVIHGLTCAVIREEIGWDCRLNTARLGVLLFALNPIALIGVGYLHYDCLHIFLLVLTAAAGRRALSLTAKPLDGWLAGLVAGILTLVRPMTLPWPCFFVLVALLAHRRSRRFFWIQGGGVWPAR